MTYNEFYVLVVTLSKEELFALYRDVFSDKDPKFTEGYVKVSSLFTKNKRNEIVMIDPVRNWFINHAINKM